MADNRILTTAQQLFGGGSYVYLYGGNGTETVTQAKPNPNLGGQHPEGLGIDCSHLVQQTLAAAGYDVPNNNSTANIMPAPGALNPAVSNYYSPVDLSNAQAGDVIMFRGHTGILQDYDPQTGVGHFYGSQSSTGPALTTFTANGTKVDPSTGRPIYWGNNEPFYGALEPISKNGLVDSNTSTNQQKPTNLAGQFAAEPLRFLDGTQLSQESGENNYLGNVPAGSNVFVARSTTDLQSLPIGGSSVRYLDSRLLFGNDPATAIAASQSATTPTTANGVMPNYSFINGMLLDTQSGQIAFGSPNGLTDTTTNWPGYSPNNVGAAPTIDANALTGLNWTAPLTELNSALAGMSYLPTDNFSWDNVPTGYDQPVILDLTGNGINITQLGRPTSSST